MVALLVIVFILVPIAELYVILQVGDAIGAPLTILLLVLDSLLGSLLLRSQGRTVWRQFNEVMAQGRVPHRELFDGIAVIFGGAGAVATVRHRLAEQAVRAERRRRSGRRRRAGGARGADETVRRRRRRGRGNGT